MRQASSLCSKLQLALAGLGTIARAPVGRVVGPAPSVVEQRAKRLKAEHISYEIPIPAVQLPFIGSPTLTFRHILGSAGVQTLPDITQIIGARLSVPFVRAELLMDTGTRKLRFRAGLSLSR